MTNFKSSEAIGKHRMILKISCDDLTKAKQILFWNKEGDVLAPHLPSSNKIDLRPKTAKKQQK